MDDNELSRGAEDDTEALLELLADLQGTEYASHAFTDQEIEALLREVAGPPPMEDPGPGEVREEAITQPGDVWLLGRHRVLCGDCTVATDVLRLCGERKARMVWTDPPYGVDYANHGNNKWGRHDPIANDALDDEGMARLWAEALTLAATVADGDLYVAAPAGPPLTILDETIRDCTPWERHQWLVWVKQQLVLGRSNYHYRHEQICYGWLRGGTSSWSVGRDQDSVFEVDRPSVSEEHPTMKPVELVAPMLENSSQPGDAVYDPFLGSGTTLIAAEKTGRLCYGMEIEGRYCDVAVVRWGLLTAKEAVLESTGQTFSEVRAERGG